MNKKITETDVILNFLEDSRLRLVKSVSFEFPAGSWTGKKDRNIADIHGPNIPGIEAKSDFSSSKRDLQNHKKNNNILHYIYSADKIKEEEISFWKENSVSACIFLTTKNKWAILNSEDGFFEKLLPLSKRV